MPDVVMLCEGSKLSRAGVQGSLKDPGSFWLFNAQICFLPRSRDSSSVPGSSTGIVREMLGPVQNCVSRIYFY